MAPTTRVVVTGGGGFLGRYLIQTLLRRRVVAGSVVDSIAVLDAGRDTQAICGEWALLGKKTVSSS
jgi:nucleoside-diphosphate-sugar epimerase